MSLRLSPSFIGARGNGTTAESGIKRGKQERESRKERRDGEDSEGTERREFITRKRLGALGARVPQPRAKSPRMMGPNVRPRRIKSESA